MNKLLLITLALLCAISCGPATKTGDKDDDEKGKEKAAPKKAEAHGPAGVVKLAGDALKNAAIELATVEKRTLVETAPAPVRIEWDGNRIGRASTLMEGRVIEVAAEVGKAVRKGDLLARIEAPELLGQPVLVKAPCDGMILERKTALGDHADKTAPLFTIVDSSVVWAMLEVPQASLSRLKLGDSFELSDPSLPAGSPAIQTAKLTYLGNEANADTLTVLVRLEAANPDGKLRAGMRLFTRIATGKSLEALAVPESALQTVEGQSAVFVAGKEDGEFVMHPVNSGETIGGWTEIRSGLQAGDRVVTRGSFVLKSELLKEQLEEK